MTAESRSKWFMHRMICRTCVSGSSSPIIQTGARHSERLDALTASGAPERFVWRQQVETAPRVVPTEGSRQPPVPQRSFLAWNVPYPGRARRTPSKD